MKTKSFLLNGFVAIALGALAQAGTITWDGGPGGTGTATDVAADWVGDALPTTSDEVLFDNSVVSPLPATLFNTNTTQTWGDLVWNTNNTSTLTMNVATGAGTRFINLSGSGGSAAAIAAGGATGDLITVGRAKTSGTFFLKGSDGTSGSTSNRLELKLLTSGNIDVVNAGATLYLAITTNVSGTAAYTTTKTGAGTLTLAMGNVNFGAAGSGSKFVLDGGTLDFNNGAGIGANPTLEIRSGTFLDNSSGTSISFNTATVQSWTGDFTFKGSSAGDLNLGAGAVTLSGAGSARTVTVAARTLTVGGAIGGSGYGLTKAGTGTLTLTGASTYDGATTVNAGNLTLNYTATQNNIINTTANSSALKFGGATLTLTGKASTANSQQFNGVTVNAGASQLTSSSGSSGSMSSTLGTITRNVGGTLNFTLPTTGTVGVSNSNDANGLLGAGLTVGAVGTAGDWATVSGGNVVAFTGYTAQNAVNSWSANQNITTTSTLSGTLASDLTINSLRLNASTTATQNIGSQTLTILDGILLTNVVNNAQTITGGSIKGSSGGDLVVINNGNSSSVLTIGSNIVNNGSATAFTKSGSRKIVLSGANNTYTGATYVNAGTLAAGVATTAFGNNSTVVVSTGATLDITGFDQTIGSLASNNAGGTGAVTLGAATLTTGADNSSTTFGGVIAGTGGLVKTGSGTQTLSGANTYTGTTTVTTGTLLISSGGSLTSNITVQSGGTIGGAGTITGNLAFDSGAHFVFNLTNTLTSTGTISFGGFGVADLTGLDSSVATGIYHLISGSVNTANLANVGIGNAYSLGSGKSAYFQIASLDLVVVPEPATWGLLAFSLTTMVLLRRRNV